MLPFIPSSAFSDSVTFQGKLRTLLPSLVVTSTDEPVSDVKEFTLSVNNNAGVCSISSDVATSMRHASKPVCKIEWTDPKSLSNFLSGLQGVVSGEGENTFEYTLTMFDKDTFVPFHSDTYSVTFQSPVEPDTATFESTWKIREQNFDTAHEIYNRNEENLSVTASVTERNYTQVIKFGELTCSIPQGNSGCIIPVNQTFGEVSPTGEKTVEYAITDPFNFIEQPPNPYIYSWDFTPPEIIDVYVNADANMLPQVIMTLGDTVVLMHNQAAVIVESPHESSDPLFLPTDPELTITQNKNLYITNTVNYLGIQVTFDLGDLLGEKDISVSPINEPLRVGQNLVYVYDFSYIRDGLYDFTFSTKDGNGNGSDREVKDVYVDRNPPDMQFIVNGKHFRSSSRATVYSLSDLSVLAWGGWADGSKIVSATLNGEAISFASGTDNVKRFEDVDLPMGSFNTIEVTAQDAVGNQRVKVFDFQSGKYSFQLTANNPLAEVEPVKFQLRQTSGLYCVMFSDPDLAQIYSSENGTSLSRGCTVEWVQYPAGIDVTNPQTLSRASSLLAQGTISNVGTYPYQFNVYSHSSSGVPFLIYEGNGDIEVSDLMAPELNVGLAHIYNNFDEDYRYALAEGYNLIVRTEVKSAKGAPLVIDLYDHQNMKVDTKVFDSPSNTTKIFFRESNNFTALSSYDYKVRAYYQSRPDQYTEKPYKFYTTPGLSVRLHLEHPSFVVEDGTLAISAKVGKRAGKTITYSASMGQWNIGLYRYDSNIQQYVQIITPVKTNNDGIASLILSAADLVSYENRIVAFAYLETPYSEIEIKRTANSLYTVPVLSSSGVSAQIVSDVFTAPVPARFLSKIEFQTTVDQNTAGAITWQTSQDGNEWESVASKYGLTNYLLILDEPSEIFVRALVENKLSKEIHYTNTVKYIGYKDAVIDLIGDKTVASGAIGRYTHSLNDYGIDNLSGQVEWSVDNKATWSSMSLNEALTIDASIDLHVRALIDIPTKSSYYIYDTLTVNVIPPRQLSAVFRSSSVKAEVGDTVTVTATFVASSLYKEEDYQYHIIRPDGSVFEDKTLAHTLTESDFTNGIAKFLFRSWVSGLELQTVSKRAVSIKKIEYNGLPTTNIILQTPERVNFSDINVRLVKPRSFNLPASVEVNQEVFLPPDGELEIKQVFGNSLRLVAKKEGVHPIRVRFYDNRGNEREHIAFVTVLAPPPMALSMVTNFYNEYLRPPFRLTNSLRFRFGSNNDRLEKVDWLINGEVIETDKRTIKQQIFTEAGDVKITARVTSEFGQIAEATESFVLLENQKPVCEPYWESRERVSTLHANCKDYDGKVVRVAFYYAYASEDMRTVYRYFTPSLAFLDGLYDNSLPIVLTALDDSDAETEIIVNWE